MQTKLQSFIRKHKPTRSSSHKQISAALSAALAEENVLNEIFHRYHHLRFTFTFAKTCKVPAKKIFHLFPLVLLRRTLPFFLLFGKCLSGKVGGGSIMRFLDFPSKNFFSHSVIFANPCQTQKCTSKESSDGDLNRI